MIWFILAAVAWYAFGVFSHIYWWTKKHDYTAGDVGVSIVFGALGPLNFGVGWMVCGEPSTRRVLIRQRLPQVTEDTP